jgi:hypothetical protein
VTRCAFGLQQGVMPGTVNAGAMRARSPPPPMATPPVHVILWTGKACCKVRSGKQQIKAHGINVVAAAARGCNSQMREGPPAGRQLDLVVE